MFHNTEHIIIPGPGASDTREHSCRCGFVLRISLPQKNVWQTIHETNPGLTEVGDSAKR